MRNKKFTLSNTFRCDPETQDMIEKLTNNLNIKKSELIRECIKKYYINF